MKHSWNFIDLSGRKYGNWRVVRFLGKTKSNNSVWIARCKCGFRKNVVGTDLVTGKTKSCGCLRDSLARLRSTTHGFYGTPEYYSWNAMKNRCLNPRNQGFRNYGGRGIKVCKRWFRFEEFLKDMGRKPSSRHSIERIKNSGHYCPSNCKWGTKVEQGNNRRTNHKLLLNGRILNASQWAELLRMKRGTLYNRLVRGWPVNLALKTPVRKYH